MMMTHPNLSSTDYLPPQVIYFYMRKEKGLLFYLDDRLGWINIRSSHLPRWDDVKGHGMVMGFVFLLQATVQAKYITAWCGKWETVSLLESTIGEQTMKARLKNEIEDLKSEEKAFIGNWRFPRFNPIPFKQHPPPPLTTTIVFPFPSQHKRHSLRTGLPHHYPKTLINYYHSFHLQRGLLLAYGSEIN